MEKRIIGGEERRIGRSGGGKNRVGDTVEKETKED